MLLSAVAPAPASPQSVLRSTKANLARTKAAIAKRSREAAKVERQLAVMDEELEIQIEKYNGIRVRLKSTERAVAANLKRLDIAISKLNDAQDLLNDRVVNIYKHGRAGMLEVFLNTNGFDDFLTTLDLLSFIADADTDMVVRIAREKYRVQKVQEGLVVRRQKLKALRSEAEAQKERIEERIDARKKYLSKLKKDVRQLLAQKRLQQRKIAIQQRKIALAAARAAAARARARAQARSRSSSSPGRLTGGSSSGGRQDIVSIAKRYLGVPYVWGGESASGLDCSGLVTVVFRQIGIELPHHAADQWRYGRYVSRSNLAPGDLVFFSRGGAGSIYHVAIYVGGGDIIEAPYTGAHVWIKSLSAKSNYYGAKRIL
ncbi:MAG: hypothetical protein C4521_07205 [Actinobacteria bacterium]|nr:MAG: hypothetical protein C4521_07205 [Actinomycetota bacterium]